MVIYIDSLRNLLPDSPANLRKDSLIYWRSSPNIFSRNTQQLGIMVILHCLYESAIAAALKKNGRLQI